jgi:acetyl esterase/lipase
MKQKEKRSVKSTPTYRDVRYGNHERNVMDVWLAESDAPAPCVMMIHGGGWLNGDKSKFTDGLERYLQAGISVVSINYRYLKQTIVDSGSTRGTGPVLERGDYPEPPVKVCLDDAARALQTIRSRAAEWNIDPIRIGLTGGSAGACTCLWLTYHDDLADPAAAEPIARQSTKPFCTAANVPQTTLDPKQVLEWMPNGTYGGHAFGFVWDSSDPTVEIRSFLAHRDEVLPWIKEYSPYELVTRDDPPVYLHYPNVRPAKGKILKETTHSANYGALLVEKLRDLGVEYEFVHKGTENPKHKTIEDYLIDILTR